MSSEIRELGETSLSKISKYIGWIIAIVSLGITIYLGFIKKNEPKLEYDIVSSTTFINNKESAAYLKILIDTIDIQENHLNISAINIKVENKGSEDISYYKYDKGFFGLRISNGKLLEPPTLLEASNEHIRQQFSQCDSIIDNQSVSVPALSLDKEDYYVMRVVLLHNIDSVPSFIAEGKIVGQKEILVNTYNSPSPNFWVIAFGGNWLVQLARFFVFLIILFFVIALIVFIGDKIDEIKSKQKRKQIIKEVTGKKNILQSVKNDYINIGSSIIEEANEIYNKTEVDISNKYKKSKDFINSKRALEKNNRQAFDTHLSRYNQITKLIEKGYLILRDDDSIVFNKDAKRSVQSIYAIVAANGMLRSQLYKGLKLNPHISINPVTGEAEVSYSHGNNS